MTPRPTIVLMLASLTLTGCQSPVVSGVSPAVRAAGSTLQTPQVAIVPPPHDPLAFSYPPDMTNYFWDVEKSYDLQSWTPLVKNCWGQPSGVLTVNHLDAPQEFVRVRKHKDWTP